jgi:hypothetical protein
MAQLLLKLNHHQNCCTYVQNNCFTVKHDTHTQSNSEGDCQLCGNINKKRSFLILVQLRKCVEFEGIFCNTKCDASYIINSPCSTVHIIAKHIWTNFITFALLNAIILVLHLCVVKFFIEPHIFHAYLFFFLTAIAPYTFPIWSTLIGFHFTQKLIINMPRKF